jgi:hypothetical protein
MVKQTWTTDDGRTFDTEEQAEAWEQRLATKQELVRILEASKRSATGPRSSSESADYKPATAAEIADFLLDEVPEAVVDAILACGAGQQPN